MAVLTRIPYASPQGCCTLHFWIIELGCASWRSFVCQERSLFFAAAYLKGSPCLRRPFHSLVHGRGVGPSQRSGNVTRSLEVFLLFTSVDVHAVRPVGPSNFEKFRTRFWPALGSFVVGSHRGSFWESMMLSFAVIVDPTIKQQPSLLVETFQPATTEWNADDALSALQD